MHEHEPQEITHEWIYLNIGVTENFIATPAANYLDDVAVYHRRELPVSITTK